jgi:hypothetical protein
MKEGKKTLTSTPAPSTIKEIFYEKIKVHPLSLNNQKIN